MRLRGRIAYKLLTLLLAGGLLLIICINYFYHGVQQQDNFLTQLPPVQDVEDDDDSSSGKQHKAQALLDNSAGNSSTRPLLSLSNFQYTLKNSVCQQYNKELLAVIIVTSYVGHDELRAAHRQAIAQTKLAELGVQRIFLLAEIPATERFINQQQLVDEQQRFGDLLQGNFVEAYRNLSYKHVMGLRWAAEDCARAKFIIKLDDDIVYDVFQLRRYLDSLEVQQTTLASSNALLAGFIIDGKAPIRLRANKWYVSEQEFGGALYPDYLSGWLYITNAATARRLVEEAQRAAAAMFWIDDTWVTGVLRERLHIPLQRLNAWYSANAEFLDCCVRDLKLVSYECEYFVGPNGGDSKLLVEFLHNVEKCYFDECIKRPPEKSLKLTCVAQAKHLVPAHGAAVVKQLKLR